MALINRITRLFTADFHAVLDRIEEPEVLLRQAIREMEDELESGEARLKHARVDHAQAEAREQRLAETLGSFDEELDICFDSGEESLARSLVRRKLETGRLLKSAAGQRELLQAGISAQQSIVEENRAALDNLRQKAALLVKDPGTTCQPGDFSILDEEVELAFLKEKLQRSPS